MERLPLKQYVALLCETIGEYDFPTVKNGKVKPAVTYDFSEDPDCKFKKGKNGKVEYPFNKVNENPHKDISLSDNSMLCYVEKDILRVEKYIHRLLHSENLQDIADGLSNVLYWGHAQRPYRDSRVSKFRLWVCNLRNTDPDELERKLNGFKELAGELKGQPISNGTPSRGADILEEIAELNLPQFGEGMSFVSKILMFLDPARYPVLDTTIANKVVNLCFSLCFPPLQGLRFEPIKISPDNARAYDTWACWCREIASVVNNTPKSPCLDVRAVDVEKALFTLADLKNIDEAKKACALLAGPEGLDV